MNTLSMLLLIIMLASIIFITIYATVQFIQLAIGAYQIWRDGEWDELWQ